MSDKVTYFGETDFRNQRTKFGIKNIDRSRHVYIIGKTGMGKSTVLENMAAQDIMNGEGMCFMDPHGSAIDVLIDYIPEHRVQDVVYFAPFDTEFPMSFNVMEAVDADKRHLVVAGLMASFKKIWVDAWSARMEYILANTLLALLEYPGATLLGVNRMLAEKDYREEVVKHVTDSSVKAFWIDEYGKWDPRYAREAGAAIQNKIGQFTSNPLIRNIVGQEKSTIDFRKIMDDKKILLVNLSKGLIGESNGNLLGGMLITKLYLAAMSRADVGAGNLKNLPDFFFFVDEFQNFANESFADILSEARKYKLNLTVAHQYVDQMEEQVASAIFGNVGTMITFRIGATDAEVFEKQFAPTFTAEDIVNLGKFQIYLSLMIDGIGSRPFSARTLAPLPTPGESMRNHVIHFSRRNFAQPREKVEADIATWYEPIKKPQKRSFRESDSQTQSRGKTASTPATLSTKKQSFIINRDVNTSQKKKSETKESAETEMKQVVSPKLNELLNKMSHQNQSIKKENTFKKPVSQKQKIEHQENNIAIIEKKESITKAPTQKKSISLKVSSSDRGANKDTASSLQDILKKAMVDKKSETNNTSKNAVAPKKEPEKPLQKKITISENPAVSAPTPSSHPKKEVPEDILKDIFK
jgi:hypothetical protein